MLRILLMLLFLTFSLLAEKPDFRDKDREKEKGNWWNPDANADLKVDTTEFKNWSVKVLERYNSREESRRPWGKFLRYLETFDDNKDGTISITESKRFLTDSKKLFTDVSLIIDNKYDVNFNKRVDKEEKILATEAITDYLVFSLEVELALREGKEVSTVFNDMRGLNDIYD